MKICKVKGCIKSTEHKKGGRGQYCSRHYQQKRKHGKILSRTIYDKNEITCRDNICEIVLYNKKCLPISKSIIDKFNYNKVKNFKFSLNNNGYVSITHKKYKFLHQLIIGLKIEHEIDHIDHNKLNNTMVNLRHATKSENLSNRNAKGYYWNKKESKWYAQIEKNKRRIQLGCFSLEKDAREAYREARNLHFGEFVFRD